MASCGEVGGGGISKVGPYDRYKWSYGAPLSRVINPVTYTYKAIYRGFFESTYNWMVGANLVHSMYTFVDMTSSFLELPSQVRYSYFEPFQREKIQQL